MRKPSDLEIADRPITISTTMQDGNLTRGWAVIAYPAEYGRTGIMSFLVGNGGVVYEKDLGKNTDKAIEQIDAFDPADGWTAQGPG